jgi:hypothetical protein
MRISLKVIGILWIGLLLIIGAMLYNAYSRLKPESIISLVKDQVQKNYPDSELSIGSIDYGFSLDFNLNFQNIDLQRNGKKLSSIKELDLKIPWWLILTNQGNAQVNISGLDIFIEQDEPGHDVLVKKFSHSAHKIRVSLPTYLSEAKYTLRAKDISIRDLQNSRRYFMVSKLLVREFQYGKNSAFELNIPITIKRKDTHYNSDLWLFGDVTPEREEWVLNYRGEFRTRDNNEKFQMEDLVIGGKANLNTSVLKVVSDLTLSIDKQSIANGQFTADQEMLNFDLKITALPLNFFGFIYEEIRNPYLLNPVGVAAGGIKFKKSFDSSLASVQGKLNFDGLFYLTEKDSIPGKWKISFRDSKWEVSFISPKGEASFFRRSVVDMNRNIVTQYIEELGFSGLDLGLTTSAVLPISKFLKSPQASYYTTTFSYKKCFLGDRTLDGQFQYGHTPDQKFYRAEISDQKSFFKINYAGVANQNALDLEMTNFRWSPSLQILAPFFSAQDAVLHGKIEGRWLNSWDTGQWKIGVNGTGLKDTQGRIPELIARTTAFFDLDSKNFEKQSFNFLGSNGNFGLNSLTLEGSELAKITGILNSKQKSYLTLTHPKNRKLKLVKKEIFEPYWMLKEEI